MFRWIIGSSVLDGDSSVYVNLTRELNKKLIQCTASNAPNLSVSSEEQMIQVYCEYIVFSSYLLIQRVIKSVAYQTPPPPY